MRPDPPLSRTFPCIAGIVAGVRGLLLALLVVLAGPAAAHKSSDAYLQIEETPAGLSLRWDIALRDLDAALDLDADGDGRLTWGEIKAGWASLEGYALARLRIAGCPLRPAGQRGLERRNDGAYAVLHLTADCRPAGAPVIAYTLFRDIDPTHRGIVKIQRLGQPLAVAVLDPTAAPAPQGDPAPAAGPVSAADTGATVSKLGFVREGVGHILTGYDHVLFLLCLLLPSVMRRTPTGWQPVDRLSQAVWPVVGIVSAFTVAHSLTLALAATGAVSLPASFIEPAIALTIVLTAIDNLWPIFPVRRVVIAFVFGLIHGFGFAGVLAELELPTAQFAWALLQFNLGLEAGQVLIVLVVTALLFAARRVRAYPAVVIRAGSCAAILLGVVWLIERTTDASLLGF